MSADLSNSKMRGVNFSHSNLTILPDVGHLTSMEAPDQVTDVLTKLISSV